MGCIEKQTKLFEIAAKRRTFWGKIRGNVAENLPNKWILAPVGTGVVPFFRNPRQKKKTMGAP